MQEFLSISSNSFKTLNYAQFRLSSHTEVHKQLTGGTLGHKQELLDKPSLLLSQSPQPSPRIWKEVHQMSDLYDLFTLRPPVSDWLVFYNDSNHLAGRLVQILQQQRYWGGKTRNKQKSSFVFTVGVTLH